MNFRNYGKKGLQERLQAAVGGAAEAGGGSAAEGVYRGSVGKITAPR